MAFYTFNESSLLGSVLRSGLDALRDGRYKLAHVLGSLQQMTAQQASDVVGVSGSAKTELESDIQKLLSDDTGVNSAVVQMLNQFG